MDSQLFLFPEENTPDKSESHALPETPEDVAPNETPFKTDINFTEPVQTSTPITSLEGKRVFVVDAHGLIYQVFHALPEMFSSDGEQVNAVYGFMRDILYLLEQHKPDFFFCAFDLPEPTFRKKMYHAYKIQRDAMPENLVSQIPRIRNLLDLMGIPSLGVPGYEADDLLATVAEKTTELGGECFLVTSDKDARQLISANVKIYSMRRNLVLDEAFLKEDWGISPEQVIEYQALVGDSSDNVPGVPLIGPKIARELVSRYGTLENIWTHLDDYFGPKTSKRKENLLNGKETALTSRQLVRLVRNVPIELPWDAAQIFRFKPENALPQFTAYQFKSLMGKLTSLHKKFHALPFTDSQLNTLNQSGQDNTDSDLINASGISHNDTETHKYYHNDDQESWFTSHSIIEKKYPAMGAFTLPEEIGPNPDDTVRNDSLTPNPPELTVITESDLLEKYVTLFQKKTQLAFFLSQNAQGNYDGLGIADVHTAISIPLFPDSTHNSTMFSCELKESNVLKQISTLFQNPHILKIGYDLKTLLLYLRRNKISFSGPFYDVMLASYMLSGGTEESGILNILETFPDLADQVAPVLPYDESETLKEKRKEKKSPLLDYLHQRIPQLKNPAFLAAVLARVTRPITENLKEKKMLELCDHLEFPLMLVLMDMEYNGIHIDANELEKASREFSLRLDLLLKEILDLSQTPDLNPESPKQLQEVLFHKLKLTPPRKTKNGFSTDADSLMELKSQHELPGKILEYRKLSKLKNTYLDALPKLIHPDTLCIHTSFNQAITATGRLSSSNPNMQNIPVRSEEGAVIRRAFTPSRNGWMYVAADYSQIELRVLAHYSQDKNLCNAFLHDEDIHARVAAQIFNVHQNDVSKSMRQLAKAVNFGVIYGQSAFGLAHQLGIPQNEASDFIHTYFNEFPNISAFLDSVLDACRLDGYVSTILGRRRCFKSGDIRERRIGQLNMKERMAINAVIQGTAADIMKLAMIAVHNRILNEKFPARMLLQIHDELLLETPAECVSELKILIADEMVNAYPLNVPLKVDVESGYNWEEV